MTEVAAKKRGAPPRRPMPVDFHERAQGASLHRLKVIYRTSNATVKRWRQEAGLSATAPRKPDQPAPHDFARLAPTMHKRGLMKHYRCGSPAIMRWLAETGVSMSKEIVLGGMAIANPVPDSFRSTAPRLTRVELAARYGVSSNTIARWVKVTGARPKPVLQNFRSGPRLPVVVGPPAGLADQATQFLRRRTIVYRADVLPKPERASLPDQGKDRWIVNGKGAVTEAELIAMAEAKGFDRLAWARI